MSSSLGTKIDAFIMAYQATHLVAWAVGRSRILPRARELVRVVRLGQGFHVYAAVVKNLRGVIYSCLGPEALGEKLSWLKRRFRYRNLGLTPSALERYGRLLGGERRGTGTLLELSPPLPGLEELISAYSELTGLRADVLEAYCYASVYVSPLLVLGEECVDALGPLVVDEVLTGRELSDKEYKLHMRIADYTVLDFYLWATSSAQEALKVLSAGGDVSHILSERGERIREDKRRYWRISADEGRRIVLYLDLLPLLAREANTEVLRALLEEHGPLMPATLAIISAVVI